MRTRAILLVEDNPDHRQLTEQALRDADSICAVVPVRDGDEALDFLFCQGGWSGRDPSLQPALVLLDLKLSRVDGLEVLKRLRGDPRTARLPIVVLTSSREEADVARAWAAGASGFMVKPSDYTEFRDALRTTARFWLDINVLPAAEPRHTT